jgi:hypothetical protein
VQDDWKVRRNLTRASRNQEDQSYNPPESYD